MKKIYFGDIHNHCNISYGFGSLEHALRAARAHLDFVAVTGHAMWPDMYEENPETAFIVGFHREGFAKLRAHWNEIREAVEAANDEELATFFSYETHSRTYGDHHIVSPDPALPLIYRDSPAELIRDVGVEAIAIPHHIGYVADYRGIDWARFERSISPVVEVYSKHGCAMSEGSPWPYYHDMGPRVTANLVEAGLRAGRRFSFAASTDHHAGYPGSYGDGLLAVQADSGARADIWAALRAGRCYALTGDRIRVDVSARTEEAQAGMGGSLPEGPGGLTLRYAIEGFDVLERVVLYRNFEPIHIYEGGLGTHREEAGVQARVVEQEADERWIVRLELGWGTERVRPYRWDGALKLNGGRHVDCSTCFRGLSVVSPTATPEGMDSDGANDLINRIAAQDEGGVEFICETVGNPSTLHPQTSALVLTIEGQPESTQLELRLNDQRERIGLADLIAGARAGHMRPWHAQAWRLHQAQPLARCQLTMELELDGERRAGNYYHLDVRQRNGQMAFVSPIFIG